MMIQAHTISDGIGRKPLLFMYNQRRRKNWNMRHIKTKLSNVADAVTIWPAMDSLLLCFCFPTPIDRKNGILLHAAASHNSLSEINWIVLSGYL